VIPHARAVRALVIAMIEAPFRARAMPPAGGSDRSAASGRPALRRAIRLAAIARRADRKRAIAAPAGLLAKRRVHGVEAATIRSNWTY
jgi:hypothetical protein